MKIKMILIGGIVSIMAVSMSVTYANEMNKSDKAGMMEKMSPELPDDKVMAMKKMMMDMAPDSLQTSVKRGENLFNAYSCNACHPGGGTSGGAADMEWKGMKMSVAIPDLHGAATHFPKAIGPMKIVSTLGGQNNMCLMVFLNKKPLDLNSQEATDLTAYVSSLSVGGKFTPGAMKIVPKPVPGAM